MRGPALAAVLLLVLGGCAPLNPFDTSYLPPGPPVSVEGPAMVAVAPVIDRRTLHTTEYPDAGRVGDAFRGALAARSLLAPGTPGYVLSVTVLEYGALQGPQARASVALHVVLKNPAGYAVYSDDVRAGSVEGPVFEADARAAPDDLRRLAQRMLNQAVDDALDKPGFRAVVHA